MALSSQTYVRTPGSLLAYPVTIDFIDRSEISVYHNDALVPYQPNFVEGAPLSWFWSPNPTYGPHVIRFRPAPNMGAVIKIVRNTNTAAMVNDFTDGAQFNAESLDENFTQLLHAVQELEEQPSGGGTGGPGNAADVSFQPTTSLSSTNVQDVVSEVEGKIPVPAIDFPRPNAAVAEKGTSTRYALEDHVHPGSGEGGGVVGYSNGVAYAYKRSPTVPTDNPGEVVYTFGQGRITTPAVDALANGWSKTVPSGTDPVYMTAASASSASVTDTITAPEWAGPVLFVKDGDSGPSGSSAATVFLYQRSNSDVAPAAPSVTCTYTFIPPGITGVNNGWTTAVPDSALGKYLYVTTATAVSNGLTDDITSSEWAPVQKMAQDGNAGAAGGQGLPGQRGTVTLAFGSYSAWNDATATSLVASAGYGVPINRDIVTMYGPGFSSTRFYNFGAWVVLTAYINGNMLVSGTLSAAVISAGSLLSNVRVQFGAGGTTNGKAFEIMPSGVVEADNIFVKFISANNEGVPSVNPVRGTSSAGSSNAAIHGSVNGVNNPNTTACGVLGRHSYYGTEGRVGTGVGFDFYASGSGTNYGPFTGAHDALVLKAEAPVVGDIMIDVLAVARGTGVSNTIFTTTRSTSPSQKGAIGVVSAPLRELSLTEPPAAFTIGYGADFTPIIQADYPTFVTTHNRAAVNALGEGMINVIGENGNILKGDLIVTSSTAGKGMKQTDDVVHGYTVARAREDASFIGFEEKKVACVYLCG